MAERLSSDEQSLVSILVVAGIDRVEAIVGVLQAVRGFERPMSDLVATLNHYPGLEDRAATEAAINARIAAGWLTRTTTGLQNDMVASAPDIAKQIATRCANAALEQQIVALQARGAGIELVGPLRSGASYETYAERLRNAHSEIQMVMVMTDPESLETVKILEERAACGVRIRVLGAAPAVAGRLRGTSQIGEAKARIAKWRKVARENAGIEYRLSDHADDLLFATSILIDGEVLRLIVHDPFAERSKEGVVLEVTGGSGKQVNLVRDFAARFHLAWEHARRPGLFGHVYSMARASVPLVIAVICLGGSYCIADATAGWGKWLGGTLQPLLFTLVPPVGSAMLGVWGSAC